MSLWYLHFRSLVIRFFNVDTIRFIFVCTIFIRFRTKNNLRDHCHDFQGRRLPMTVMILNILLLDSHLSLNQWKEGIRDHQCPNEVRHEGKMKSEGRIRWSARDDQLVC